MIDICFDSIRFETDKAILLEFEHVVIWIPLSLIKDKYKDIITIPLWFAEKHELEVYEI